MSLPSIAILVLFYEKAEQTVECLKSFEGCGLPVYLLDNGSSPGSRESLEAYVRNLANIHWINEATNIGVGPGRNRLIGAATEDWLFFVDNDIIIDTPDWLLRLTEQIRNYPDVEVFIPRLYNWHEKQWQVYSDFEVVGRELRRRPVADNEINNFPGGAAVVRRTLFDRLGGYDEQMFVGGEDYEFSLRGLLAGCPVRGLLMEDVVLVHYHRQARDPGALTAAVVRYDLERISASMQYIQSKHGIVVFSGWQEWTPRKLRLMTRGEPFWLRLKRLVKSLLGKNDRYCRRP